MIVAVGVRASEPQILLEEITKQNKAITLLHSRTLIKHDYNPKHRIISTFLDANVRGRAEYIPIHFSRLPRYFDELKIDLAIMQVAYDPKKGYSFGTNADYNSYFLKAKKIWVEVNKQMPWVQGPALPAAKIDRAIEVDYPLPEHAIELTPDDVEVYAHISKYLNRFINDGTVLQLGIGKLQSSLHTDKKVTIYSEMISDWVMKLNTTKIIAGFGMGTQNFYRWLDHNPKVELRPIGALNHPRSFEQFDDFVSINSALEVDLFGQVASESLHYKQLSGTGGSNDFTAGAALAKNGVSIVAIPSVTSKGRSKIVPRLQNLVTIPRADIDYVVTEYGIAELRHKTVQERARALASIAHPKHRQELLESIAT